MIPLVGILLLAINLRPAITVVGPVITDIGHDLSLTGFELGLLGALPIATFGLVSAFVQVLIARFGVERLTVGAMIVLTLATVLRSWPGPNANLWIGTLLIGASIAVGNVAVPVFVKRGFPHASETITGVYVAVLGVCAGISAAVAVPIADASLWGWRLSLGIWAGLTVLAVVFWAGQALAQDRVEGGSSVPIGTRNTNLWRSPQAWQLSLYMGSQSAVFYVGLTWLPTVEQHLGYSPVTAGLHMLGLQIAGIIGNLLAPVFMRVGPDERFAAVFPGVVYLVSISGLLTLPGLALLWILLLGFGTGISFVVALSLLATRASHITTAGKLSAMAQGIGYTFASIVLFTAGAIAGTNTVGVVFVLLCAGGLVGVMGFLTGRKHMVDA